MFGRNAGELMRINLSLRIGPTLATAAGAILLAYLLFPAIRTELAYMTGVIGVTAALYSAYHVGAAMHLKLHHDRLERSFALLDRLNDRQFVRVRMFIEKRMAQATTAGPAAALHREIVSNKRLLAAVTLLLGIYEDLSLAVQHGHVDERVLYQSLGYIIPFNYKHLRAYIEQERIVSADNSLYAETERLVTSWDQRRFLGTGEAMRIGMG